MNMAFATYRLGNQILSTFAPALAAEKATQKFLSPRRFEPKAWELKGEARGIRFNINQTISAIKWLPENENSTNKRVLLAHGWESRATQMYGFVPHLLKLGYQVVAIDMPAHGFSKGSTSDAYQFTQAILLAEQSLGVFDLVIGHSMGAGATSAAVSQGLKSKKLILISGPSSIENVLRRFSGYVGLNPKATDLFVEFTGDKVGVKPAEIDSVIISKSNNIPTLFVHDRLDLEVPISESENLLSTFTNSELFITEGLGHRKILKSEMVLNKIDRFLQGSNLRGSSLDGLVYSD